MIVLPRVEVEKEERQDRKKRVGRSPALGYAEL